MIIDNFSGEYEFLSNFYPSDITMDDGIVYPTVEHAFQATKSGDMVIRTRIAEAPTPGLAKRMGRAVALRKDWEKVKDDVMLVCVRRKFQHPDLAQKLLDTGDAELVEGTVWHDNYWGNCTCDKCKDIVGRNHLGKILMQVRDELRTKE